MCNQTTWLAIGAILVVWALARSGGEGYGPWPGARAAVDPPPLHTRPHQVREYQVREAPPDSTGPSWALAQADGSYGTYPVGDAGNSVAFDSYFGGELSKCSDTSTDDVAQTWVETRRAGEASDGIESVAKRSTGRSVSGQLNDVELSA